MISIYRHNAILKSLFERSKLYVTHSTSGQYLNRGFLIKNCADEQPFRVLCYLSNRKITKSVCFALGTCNFLLNHHPQFTKNKYTVKKLSRFLYHITFEVMNVYFFKHCKLQIVNLRKFFFKTNI